MGVCRVSCYNSRFDPLPEIEVNCVPQSTGLAEKRCPAMRVAIERIEIIFTSKTMHQTTDRELLCHNIHWMTSSNHRILNRWRPLSSLRLLQFYLPSDRTLSRQGRLYPTDDPIASPGSSTECTEALHRPCLSYKLVVPVVPVPFTSADHVSSPFGRILNMVMY